MTKVLSKKADQFIMELNMYLMSKGKNDEEINGILVEIEDHLIQAEAEGKNIRDITGDSPRAYMKSIGQEMGFDRKQFLTLAPMTALLLIAFSCFTPAVWGDFTLSEIGVWGAIAGAILSFALYGFLFVNVFPRVYYSKWFYIIGGAVYTLITGFFILILLFDKDPFFVATPMQNNLIVLGCIVVFIIWGFYAKTWSTILIPFFMSWGPIANRFIPAEVNQDPFYITIITIFLLLITIVGFYFMFRKGRKRKSFVNRNEHK